MCCARLIGHFVSRRPSMPKRAIAATGRGAFANNLERARWSLRFALQQMPHRIHSDVA